MRSSTDATIDPTLVDKVGLVRSALWLAPPAALLGSLSVLAALGPAAAPGPVGVWFPFAWELRNAVSAVAAADGAVLRLDVASQVLVAQGDGTIAARLRGMGPVFLFDPIDPGLCSQETGQDTP